MHRSALGKTVDMSSIATRNEKVRAVGNMNVNARGDILNSNNEVVTDATRRVRNTYNHSVKNGGTDIPFGEHVPLMADPDELTPEEKELFKDDEDTPK